MNSNDIVHELLNFGLTQKDIERRCGIKQCVVSALKTGRYGKRTPYNTVCALKNLLDTVRLERAVSTKEAP